MVIWKIYHEHVPEPFTIWLKQRLMQTSQSESCFGLVARWQRRYRQVLFLHQFSDNFFYCMLIVPHTRHARHRERELVMHPANWMLWTVILWRSHVELCLVVWTSWRVGTRNSLKSVNCCEGLNCTQFFFVLINNIFTLSHPIPGPGSVQLNLIEVERRLMKLNWDISYSDEAKRVIVESTNAR